QVTTHRSWNVLEEIDPETFHPTPTLESLDLSHNSLQNLTEQRYLLFIQNLRGLDLTSNLFHTINLGADGSLGDIQAEKVCMSNEVELMGMNPKGDHSYLVKLLKGRGADNTSHLHLASMVITWEHLTNTVNAVHGYPHPSFSDTPRRDTFERGWLPFSSPWKPSVISSSTMTETSIIHMTCPSLPSGILQLDFSDCTLTDTVSSRVELQIAVDVQHMSSLRHLDLSLNSLVYSGQECHCQLVFSCLPNSTPTLDLQNNQISNVPEALLALDSLLALYLSTNRLRNLRVCAGFPHLKYLLLTENSLHAPSLTGLGACPVLRVLNTSRNPFTRSLRGFRDLGTFGTGLGKGFQIQEISCNVGLLATAIWCPVVTVIIVMATLCHHLDVPWYLSMIWQGTQAKHHSRTQQVQPQDLEGVLFHSFMSYSQHNADGVNELRARGLHICRHERDFVPGKTIVENIIQCVEKSRRCVHPLWTLRPERVVLLRAVLLLPTKAMMCRHTYLEWPQDRGKHRLFWANLWAALTINKTLKEENNEFASF
uniref:Toll-like receptor 1 n=1 Tax=Oncorhynchus kisutch TaxID=8019 RepID=A0A8C7CWU0_ONCKI